MQRVKISDPGLYAVYVGVVSHEFISPEVDLVDTQIINEPIDFDILDFFNEAKAYKLNGIIKSVLMLYRHKDLVKEAHKNGDHYELIRALDSVLHTDKYNSWSWFRTAEKYFGSLDNFKEHTPVIDDQSLEEFMEIGKRLQRIFK